MKIKALRDAGCAGHDLEEGKVYLVDDSDATTLIKLGKAEEYSGRKKVADLTANQDPEEVEEETEEESGQEKEDSEEE